MTVEEIKQTYSMRDILSRYGIQVRGNMCKCPFHGADKHPSMKVFKDGYNCFTCGANGDIFTFVQNMDNCDFKTAFYSLGGEYQKPTKASKTALYRLEKARKNKQKEEQKIKDKIVRNNTLIHASRELFKQSEPLSDDWWYYMDIYHMALIKDINLEGGEKH